MMSSSSCLFYMLTYTTYCILLVSSQTKTLSPSTSQPTLSPSLMPTSNPTLMPTSNPTLVTPNPTPLPTPDPTESPTSEPTLEPTISTDLPTTAPSAAPTVIPTIKKSFCNLFNGKTIQNIIQVEQNTIISNINIEDPLIITFDFIIGENECTNTDNQICNLLQFGKYSSPSGENVSFPRISTINKNGTLHWIIEIDEGNNSIILNNTENKSEESFAIKANIKSSFHITFSGFQRAIYIGTSLYYYNYDNESDFSDFTNETHPFYISEPDTIALNANITNLCISTGSFAPTVLPTQHPTIIPTFSPTYQPTEKEITTTLYSKIDCYTEYGSPGDTSIYCSSKPNYIIISCGIIKLNGININDIIFYKGMYIERYIINDLTTDGICYINYNILNKNITQYIQPQARCCNFAQQYNNQFKCRYFKSDINSVNNQQSTEEAAKDSNDFTFTTCPNKFPLLLSCNTILNEDNRVTAYAETNNDIQFYGSFYADSAIANSDGEYNPDKNLYFELNTGINSSKEIPFPPSTYVPTSRVVSTPSPTYRPTSSRTILELNISSTTHCVSQYGPIKGNYTIISIATCCTESYDDTSPSTSDISQPTEAPTTSPTMRSPLETELIGTNGTNTGKFYIENKASDSIIIGISTWSIYQVKDTNKIDGIQYRIWYQGLLIGSYETMDSNGIIETKFTSSDFAGDTQNFETMTSCAAFILDIDENGNRDFINGYDVYYTHIAIYGITFYTSFGRQYSCPDHQEFVDTSLQVANNEPCSPTTTCPSTIAEKYYNIIRISERNIFAVNGTYKLSGWKGWLQTRTLGPGVIRSIYGSIHFLFIGNATIYTLSPTISPTISPTNNKIKTLSPTFAGQETSESLKCYTIWGNKQIECKNPIYDSMFGCNGYSVEGQIFNIYINNTNDKCIVETINNKPAAAIGTCCYFYQTPPRNFNVLIYTSIVSGSIFFTLFIFMISCLFFNIKTITYFEEADVDDDTKIDRALEENIGEDYASDTIAQFKVTERDHAEMIELARKNSISIGLQE